MAAPKMAAPKRAARGAALAASPAAAAAGPPGSFADILESETEQIVSLLQDDRAAGNPPRDAGSIADELGISFIRVNLLLAGLIGAPNSRIRKLPGTPPTYQFM